MELITWAATSARATAPKFANDDDLAMDMYATELHTIEPGTLGYMVDLGVILGDESVDEVKGMLLTLRSSMAAKTGLRVSNSIGLIEAKFSGFVKDNKVYGITLLLDNIGTKTEIIKPGDRVAQLMILRRSPRDTATYAYPTDSQIIDWAAMDFDHWQLFYADRRNGLGSTGQ